MNETFTFTMPAQKRRPFWKYRPAALATLGLRLHPETITDAWYAAGCPPKLHPLKHGVSLGDTLKWKLACLLRGC